MRRQHFDLAADTNVLVGKPASPPSEQAIVALADALTDLPEVAEAHLAECFIPRVSEAPALVLILVLRQDASAERVMGALSPRLGRIVPPGEYLDVWPLPSDHRVVAAVRSAGCAILARA